MPIQLSEEDSGKLLNVLDTASLSILRYEHDRTDQPAIALWNSPAKESTVA